MANKRVDQLDLQTNPLKSDTMLVVNSSGKHLRSPISPYVEYSGEFYYTNNTLTIPENPDWIGLPSLTHVVDEGDTYFTEAIESVNGVNSLVLTALQSQIAIVQLNVHLTSSSISTNQLRLTEVRDEGSGWVIATDGAHTAFISENANCDRHYITVARTIRVGWKYTWMFSADGDDLSFQNASFNGPLSGAVNTGALFLGFARYAPIP